MIATNSADLLPNPIVLMDQTDSANLAKKITADAFDGIIQQWFSQTIKRFADCTDNGEDLLRKTSQGYKIYIYSYHGTTNTRLHHYFQIDVAPTMAIDRSSHRWTSLPVTHQLPHLEVRPPHIEAIEWIKTATGFSQERIGLLIGVTRQAINDWKRGFPIADHNRRRLFAVLDVLKRASLQHPTSAELAAWLDTPCGADGRTPAQLLEDNEINRARLFAVSSPSPGLRQVPSWVNQPIPEAFRVGAERRQKALPPDTDNELIALINEEHSTDEDGEDLALT